jgi:hypothetical protein
LTRLFRSFAPLVLIALLALLVIGASRLFDLGETTTYTVGAILAVGFVAVGLPLTLRGSHRRDRSPTTTTPEASMQLGPFPDRAHPTAGAGDLGDGVTAGRTAGGRSVSTRGR